MMAILTAVKWFVIVGLIYSFLIISDAEDVFLCLLAINIFSLEKSWMENGLRVP